MACCLQVKTKRLGQTNICVPCRYALIVALGPRHPTVHAGPFTPGWCSFCWLVVFFFKVLEASSRANGGASRTPLGINIKQKVHGEQTRLEVKKQAINHTEGLNVKEGGEMSKLNVKVSK